MHIILTSYELAKQAQKQNPQAIMRSMVMKPLANIKNVALLAPTEQMVKGHKHGAGDKRFAKWKPITTTEYTNQYRTIINKNMPALKEWYGKLYADNEQVLLLWCYCQPGKFCHRQLVAKTLRYLNEKMGLSHIIELDSEEKLFNLEGGLV